MRSAPERRRRKSGSGCSKRKVSSKYEVALLVADAGKLNTEHFFDQSSDGLGINTAVDLIASDDSVFLFRRLPHADGCHASDPARICPTSCGRLVRMNEQIESRNLKSETRNHRAKIQCEQTNVRCVFAGAACAHDADSSNGPRRHISELQHAGAEFEVVPRTIQGISIRRSG